MANEDKQEYVSQAVNAIDQTLLDKMDQCPATLDGLREIARLFEQGRADHRVKHEQLLTLVSRPLDKTRDEQSQLVERDEQRNALDVLRKQFQDLKDKLHDVLTKIQPALLSTLNKQDFLVGFCLLFQVSKYTQRAGDDTFLPELLLDDSALWVRYDLDPSELTSLAHDLVQAGASVAAVKHLPIIQNILSYDWVEPTARDNLVGHLPQLPEALAQLIAIQSLPEPIEGGFGSQHANIDSCFAEINLPFSLYADFYDLIQAHALRKPLQSLRAQVQTSIEQCDKNEVYTKDPAAINQLKPILTQLLQYTQHLEDYPAYAQNNNGDAATLQQSNPQPVGVGVGVQALPTPPNIPNDVRGLDMSSSLDATNPRRWGPGFHDANSNLNATQHPSLNNDLNSAIRPY